MTRQCYPETVEGITLDVRLFYILAELGVTEVHLAEHALLQLQRKMRGLFVSTTDVSTIEELDVGWAGTICGVKFYKDLDA